MDRHPYTPFGAKHSGTAPQRTSQKRNFKVRIPSPSPLSRRSNQSPLFDSAKRPFPRKPRETFRTKREFRFESRNLRDRTARRKSPFAGFPARFADKNWETRLVGWRASADRTSLRPPFPANREFYREFRRVDGFAGTPRAEFQQIIGLFSAIPWNQEQGNLRCEQGLIIQEHGPARCRTPAGQSTTPLKPRRLLYPKADISTDQPSKPVSSGIVSSRSLEGHGQSKRRPTAFSSRADRAKMRAVPTPLLEAPPPPAHPVPGSCQRPSRRSPSSPNRCSPKECSASPRRRSRAVRRDRAP